MTGPRFYTPSFLSYIPSGAPPVTNAEAETSDRASQLDAQRAHLHELRNWAHGNRGPCRTCRWEDGSGGYETCMNPAVLRGTTDPVDGEVLWEGPRCRSERSSEEYPDEYFNRPRRWTGKPLCGPLGLLWEERTQEQVLTRWLLSGLHLLWIIPSLLVVGGIILSIMHGPAVRG